MELKEKIWEGLIKSSLVETGNSNFYEKLKQLEESGEQFRISTRFNDGVAIRSFDNYNAESEFDMVTESRSETFSDTRVQNGFWEKIAQAMMMDTSNISIYDSISYFKPDQNLADLDLKIELNVKGEKNSQQINYSELNQYFQNIKDFGDYYEIDDVMYSLNKNGTYAHYIFDKLHNELSNNDVNNAMDNFKQWVNYDCDESVVEDLLDNIKEQYEYDFVLQNNNQQQQSLRI